MELRKIRIEQKSEAKYELLRGKVRLKYKEKIQLQQKAKAHWEKLERAKLLKQIQQQQQQQQQQQDEQEGEENRSPTGNGRKGETEKTRDRIAQ